MPARVIFLKHCSDHLTYPSKKLPCLLTHSVHTHTQQLPKLHPQPPQYNINWPHHPLIPSPTLSVSVGLDHLLFSAHCHFQLCAFVPGLECSAYFHRHKSQTRMPSPPRSHPRSSAESNVIFIWSHLSVFFFFHDPINFNFVLKLHDSVSFLLENRKSLKLKPISSHTQQLFITQALTSCLLHSQCLTRTGLMILYE